MTGGELTSAQIRALLHELGRRLNARDAHGGKNVLRLTALSNDDGQERNPI